MATAATTATAAAGAAGDHADARAHGGGSSAAGLTQGVLVELPVAVRSDGGAVRLLGGSAGVTGLTAAVAAPPRLWLRPDDMLSHPVAGDVAPATAFLLRVTRQRRRAAEAAGGNGVGAAAGMASTPEYRVNPPVVTPPARLSRRVTFTRLADFQYVLPAVPAARCSAPEVAAALVAAANDSGSGGGGSGGEGVAPATAALIAALEAAPLAITPASFARHSHPHTVPWQPPPARP